MDTNGLLLIETKKEGVVTLDEGEGLQLPLSFTHLRNNATITSIKEICSLLGCYGNTDVVIDTLIHQVTGSYINRSEHLLIFHWILKGVEIHCSLNRVVDCVLELFEEKGRPVYVTCLLLHLLEDVAAKQGNHMTDHVTMCDIST